jgi:hypothetical protein
MENMMLIEKHLKNDLVLMCVKGLMSLKIAKKFGLGDLH